MNWCCALAWLLAGCQTHPPSPKTELIQRSQPLLGTFVTISAYGTNRATLQDALSAAFEEVHQVDTVMSLHRADSELSQLNAGGATNPVPVSAELSEVLALAHDIARQTDGAFDVTIRPLADLWGFIWKEYRLPTKPELQAVLPRVDYRLVRLDRAKGTVQFLAPGISIDLGGIGKGFAVDRATRKLQQFGIAAAMVKAGGDLRVIGAPPGQTAWNVQLEDPAKRGRRVTLPLRDAALSTSGNYENFFEAGGKRYSHILDPRTGMPVEGVAACSVIASTCAESDAWATAAMVYGAERSLHHFGDRFPMRFSLLPDDRHSQEFTIRASTLFPQTAH